MKISDINFTNIKALVEGTTNHLLDQYGPMWTKVALEVKEQVAFRSEMCKPCVENGACLHCGCKIPGLFYAEKGCRIGNYPLLLNKESWEDFKKNIDGNNVQLNKKYYQVWECECGSKNAYPYTYCYNCNKKHSMEEIKEKIEEYIK